MVKWTHEVSGTAIHPLSVNQSCTCAAHHVCQSCQGQGDHLRAVNAKLLAALEGLVKTMNEELSALVDTGKVNASKTRFAFTRAREAIEEANK